MLRYADIGAPYDSHEDDPDHKPGPPTAFECSEWEHNAAWVTEVAEWDGTRSEVDR